MDKALEIGKSSATGSFHLLIGVAASTIIMAVGTLVLAGLLPADQVGLYGIAFIPATIIGLFRDWGVNNALTQQIASLRAQGKDSEIHDVIYSGIIFEIITGIILSVVCFAIAEPLAYLLSPSDAGNLTVYISIVSISIFAGALVSAASGIFVGFERMKLNSFTQILQAVVKTALGPLLIVIGFGVLGAIYAYLASIIAGGAISILLVYFTLFRHLHKCEGEKSNVKKILKPMLNYGFPLTVSTIISGVLPQVLVFIMAIYAGTEMMGNYYVSTYFVTLLTFISTPVSMALFPVFSKLDPEKEPLMIKTIFASASKYISMLIVPATLLLVTLSTPLVNTLFPKQGIINALLVADAAPKYQYAPLFLSLTVLGNLFAVVGGFTVSAFQIGIGKTKQIMKQSIVSLAIGLPVAYFLIVYFYSIGGPLYALIGGLIGNIIASLPTIAWSLYWSWKNYKVKADFNISARILASSALASILTFLIISLLRTPYIIALVAGSVIFMVAYLVGASLIGAINQTDVDNFKAMLSGMGWLSRLLDYPLYIIQQVNKAKHETVTTSSSKTS